MRAVYYLEIEPLLIWLERQMKCYETVDELARALKQETPWLLSIMRGRVKTVDIDKADELLCIEGGTHLRDLYPNLYDEG